jgi:hypothetical protein
VIIFTLQFFEPEKVKMTSSGTYTVTSKTGTRSGSAWPCESGGREATIHPDEMSRFGAWRPFDASGPVHYGPAASHDG